MTDLIFFFPPSASQRYITWKGEMDFPPTPLNTNPWGEQGGKIPAAALYARNSHHIRYTREGKGFGDEREGGQRNGN